MIEFVTDDQTLTKGMNGTFVEIDEDGNGKFNFGLEEEVWVFKKNFENLKLLTEEEQQQIQKLQQELQDLAEGQGIKTSNMGN